jgi:hypothetical protein
MDAKGWAKLRKFTSLEATVNVVLTL